MKGLQAVTTGQLGLGIEDQVAVASRRATIVQPLVLGLYGMTIFLGASLVFLIQPMITRMILPTFGGSPSVWNTALVFFQAVLLAGYCYAHFSTRLLGLRRQPLAHLGLLLLPLLILPITIPNSLTALDNTVPVLRVLLILAASVGLPFFVVSTASPLLQRWFAQVDHPAAADPYFLYVASNVGSLFVLVSYPFLIEPVFSLSAQARIWAGGYVGFVALTVGCVAILMRSQKQSVVPVKRVEPISDIPLTVRERARWVLLAFIPSSLMVGVTTHLSTDVASIPLLWILPLSIYLVTFIVAFARPRIAEARVLGLMLIVLALVSQLMMLRVVPVGPTILIHAGLLLVVGLAAHGQLALRRPHPSRLTEFYLLMSLGGVLGGAFNSLLAPIAFNTVIEYPLVVLLAVVLRLGRTQQKRDSSVNVRRRAMTYWVVCGMAFAVLIGTSFAVTSKALYAHRSFFGVLQVKELDGNRHVVQHGTTLHGLQDMTSDESRRTPLSYYSHAGPLGQAFAALQASEPFDEIAAVGLGAGAVAAYGQPGQHITFYEIDPEIVRVAEDPRYFTYVNDSEADISMVVGDGRMRLEEVAPGRFDFLIMDAFSSDSVPVHLLTREAIVIYFEKLKPDGVVAFHISNRHLDLAPVLNAIAADLGLSGLVQLHAVSAEEYAAGTEPSHWVILSADSERLDELAADSRWTDLREEPGTSIWTDDFSNIVSTINWFR